MKVIARTNDGRWMVWIHPDDPGEFPGMQMVVIVDRNLRTSPVLKSGSVLAQADAGEWIAGPGDPPAAVLEAARKSLR